MQLRACTRSFDNYTWVPNSKKCGKFQHSYPGVDLKSMMHSDILPGPLLMQALKQAHQYSLEINRSRKLIHSNKREGFHRGYATLDNDKATEVPCEGISAFSLQYNTGCQCSHNTQL